MKARRAPKARTLSPLARHSTIQRRHCRSFRSSRVLPWVMIVPSFRRDYTTAVKNAIRRTDTIFLRPELRDHDAATCQNPAADGGPQRQLCPAGRRLGTWRKLRSIYGFCGLGRFNLLGDPYSKLQWTKVFQHRRICKMSGALGR
jgi:hypothetical protein